MGDGCSSTSLWAGGNQGKEYQVEYSLFISRTREWMKALHWVKEGGAPVQQA